MEEYQARLDSRESTGTIFMTLIERVPLTVRQAFEIVSEWFLGDISEKQLSAIETDEVFVHIYEKDREIKLPPLLRSLHLYKVIANGDVKRNPLEKLVIVSRWTKDDDTNA